MEKQYVMSEEEYRAILQYQDDYQTLLDKFKVDDDYNIKFSGRELQDFILTQQLYKDEYDSVTKIIGGNKTVALVGRKESTRNNSNKTDIEINLPDKEIKMEE